MLPLPRPEQFASIPKKPSGDRISCPAGSMYLRRICLCARREGVSSEFGRPLPPIRYEPIGQWGSACTMNFDQNELGS
jgi:hypothetical protein